METVNKGKGKHYSLQVKERAIELFNEGSFDTKEIARELGVNHNTIRLWMKKAGLKKLASGTAIKNLITPKIVERNETIYNLYFYQKKTQPELAEQFGITKQRVQQILEAKIKRDKIPPNVISLMTRLRDIYSLEEAAVWADNNKVGFNLEKTPNAEVLKAAAQDGRLAAVKKGSVWLTSESELRIYLANFHPGRGGHRRVKI